MYQTESNSSTPLYVVVAIVLMTITIFSLKVGLERQEKSECLKWQKLEQTHINFQPSDLMNEQCSQYNIEFKP